MFTELNGVHIVNKIEYDVLIQIKECGYENQRELSLKTNYSLGAINKAVKKLVIGAYLDLDKNLTEKANELIMLNKPKNAVILAAGFGMCMVPINQETPKALLEVNGERLIERIIKQLHAVGIEDINVVVGYKKECFEYLIDDYGVNLVLNSDYAIKNNLHSLALVKDKLNNSYIIPSDVYAKENPFNNYELYSWYLLSDRLSKHSDVEINRKEELVKTNGHGLKMIGISYLCADTLKIVKKRLEAYKDNYRYDNCFWEETLYDKDKMIVYANLKSANDVYEIDTYEQLREIDEDSKHLKSNIIEIIVNALNVDNHQITNIKTLKKGMTNRSFLFECNKHKYIMRIPGEGTDQLVNRREEYEVYQLIKDRHISDDIIYINPNNGYKISRFINNARACNPHNKEDLVLCMKYLREFHNLKLKTNHVFNLFDKLEFYEGLWNGQTSIYRDYKVTKANVYKLKEYIDQHEKSYYLTHIDAVPDNFLITRNNNQAEVRLIDWEYAANQDQDVDIAMFCIYALYERVEVEQLIDIYYENNCSKETRIKIYCYIAVCGLVWSNWCEYKLKHGIEFGDYSIKQYRFAKDYYRLAKKEIEALI